MCDSGSEPLEDDGGDWEGDERHPTVSFGPHVYTYPGACEQDLQTLERECVVYADHWIEEIGDFRHVRIDFTPEERKEFVRRSWAYELFLREEPMWATEVVGIEEDIARDADNYSAILTDGTEIRPPYHCFAAFLGRHLEALVCSRNERETVIQLDGKKKALFEVRRAIDSLTATIRSFNNRERGLVPWTISCEDDVRDLLYVMLRASVFDIAKEEAIPSKAGTHKFADLCSNHVPFLLELKWIGRKGDWKKKIEEIHVDIQTYATHPACETIFFVIVDDVRDVPDPRGIERELTAQHRIDGREVKVVLLVCDT